MAQVLAGFSKLSFPTMIVTGWPQTLRAFSKLTPDVVLPRGGMRNGNVFLAIETSTTGSFSGTVSVNSTVVANAVVRIYRQDTGELVAKTKTNAVGAYTITGLSPNTTYMMVADDPASTENSAVFAREVPA